MGNNKDKPENFFMDSFWEWIYWSAVENGWKEDETGLEACETTITVICRRDNGSLEWVDFCSKDKHWHENSCIVGMGCMFKFLLNCKPLETKILSGSLENATLISATK